MILQHPDEARHPLNTARLAVLGLERAELLIGEEFPELEARIRVESQATLLFPDDANAPETSAGRDNSIQTSLLIVPDGTWRKARRIVRLNPVLQELPRLALPPGEPSAYRVRRATEPGAVATIEAIERALSILEPEQDFQPILRPFEAMVSKQIASMKAAGAREAGSCRG